MRGIEYERLLDEFSDKLNQAVNGPGSNEAEASSGTGSGIAPRGWCVTIHYPALPCGGPPDGSEIVQFDMTVNCPVAAFTRIKPVLISYNVVSEAVVAWQHGSDEEFQVIWPIGYRERFHDYDEIV
jgi:hypothetical protein